MDLQNWFSDLLDEVKDTPEFKVESVIGDITEAIAIRMQKKRITKKMLAEKLEVSPSAITKFLIGQNFTIKTLVKVAEALDVELKVDFAEREPVAMEVCDCRDSRIPVSAADDSREIRDNDKIYFLAQERSDYTPGWGREGGAAEILFSSANDSGFGEFKMAANA